MFIFSENPCIIKKDAQQSKGGYEMAADRKVHVVYNGRNEDLTFEELFPQDRYPNLGITAGTDVNANTLTQEQVRTALAQHYDVGLNEFEDHYIEFASNGNITVRPNATFGVKDCNEESTRIAVLKKMTKLVEKAVEAE
jgi:hypothetical protein